MKGASFCLNFIILKHLIESTVVYLMSQRTTSRGNLSYCNDDLEGRSSLPNENVF